MGLCFPFPFPFFLFPFLVLLPPVFLFPFPFPFPFLPSGGLAPVSRRPPRRGVGWRPSCRGAPSPGAGFALVVPDSVPPLLLVLLFLLPSVVPFPSPPLFLFPFLLLSLFPSLPSLLFPLPLGIPVLVPSPFPFPFPFLSPFPFPSRPLLISAELPAPPGSQTGSSGLSPHWVFVFLSLWVSIYYYYST